MRGHVRPRGRGVWQVVIEAGTVDGKRKQQYRTVRGTKRDAELVLARMLVERGASAMPTDPTVGEVVEQYIATRPHSPTTTEYMKLAQSRIPATLLKQPAWKVRGPDLSMMYRALERDGLSVHSVHRVHVLLSAAFGRAMKWGVLSVNPAAAAECPTPRARQIQPPGMDDVARLLRIHAAGEVGEPQETLDNRRQPVDTARMPDDTPLVYSIAEAASVLRTSRDSVERLILRGDLRYVRVNRRNKVIPRAELERFVAERTESAA